MGERGWGKEKEEKVTRKKAMKGKNRTKEIEKKSKSVDSLYSTEDDRIKLSDNESDSSGNESIVEFGKKGINPGGS